MKKIILSKPTMTLLFLLVCFSSIDQFAWAFTDDYYELPQEYVHDAFERAHEQVISEFRSLHTGNMLKLKLGASSNTLKASNNKITGSLIFLFNYFSCFLKLITQF
jgi:hypothetical protein